MTSFPDVISYSCKILTSATREPQTPPLDGIRLPSPGQGWRGLFERREDRQEGARLRLERGETLASLKMYSDDSNGKKTLFSS